MSLQHWMSVLEFTLVGSILWVVVTVLKATRKPQSRIDRKDF